MNNHQGYDPAVDSTLYVNEILLFTGDKSLIRGWILRQLHEWNWLAKTDSILSEIHTLLFKNKLQPALEGTEINPCDVRIGSKSEPYIDANSETGIYIQEIMDTYGEIVAAFFIAFRYEHNRKLIAENLGESFRLFASEKFYESGLALQLILNLEIDSKSDTQSDASLQSTQRKQTSKYLKDLDSSRAFIQTKINALTEKLDNKESELTTVELNTRKTLIRYQKITKRGLRYTASKMQKAEREWDTTKARLKEQLEIDQSVSHWKSLKKINTYAKIGWLSTAILLMIATTLIMLCYYAKGGVSEIIKSPIFAHTVDQLPNNPNKPDSGLPATPYSDAKISIGSVSADTKLLVFFATNIGGAALLLTFLVALIRISLRRYSINASLAENATERLAFIRTYLSLMDEGKLEAREDRILVLNALFRNSTQVTASDPHITSPIELILKSAEKK